MINTEHIEKAFKKMGADFKLEVLNRVRGDYTIDVKDGTFIINVRDGFEFENITVVDIDTDDRHSLLNITTKTNRIGRFNKDKWLCGHDERDWFVGAIPKSNVKNIKEAKDALKPKAVLDAEAGIPAKEKHKRKNKARLRQGEWFFIPVDISDNGVIHKDEPISRGEGSKSHIIEEVFRTGGIPVWVKGRKILSEEEYEALPDEERFGWQHRTRDASVYGRGYVKHPDHATIYLDGWHMVVMNTENESSRRSNMIFLD